MADPAAVLIAARDEEGRIGVTVRALLAAFPAATVIVADDGSRDATAAEAELAGATVLRLPHRGKGQALTLAERAAPPGPLLLCDADLRGDLRPLAASGADLAIAAFSRRQGGGFGLAKRIARAAIRSVAAYDAREPLSGQRALSTRSLRPKTRLLAWNCTLRRSGTSARVTPSATTTVVWRCVGSRKPFRTSKSHWPTSRWVMNCSSI